MSKDTQLPAEYDPINCEHKLPTGLTAWQFQSEEQSNLNGGPNKVAIFVCIECGEISIGGYRTGVTGDHNSFDEHFNITYPDAIDAIIKQANYFNEQVKWGRIDQVDAADYASRLVEARQEIEQLRTGNDAMWDLLKNVVFQYSRNEFGAGLINKIKNILDGTK